MRPRIRLLRTALIFAVILCLQGPIGFADIARADAPPRPYDFNGDGYADLAIGVPGDRVGRKPPRMAEPASTQSTTVRA